MGPSTLLFGSEGIRAMYEYGLGFLLSTPLQELSEKGDGHPVIIIPGLGTTDSSTTFARSLLADIGYTPYPWGLGRNLGPRVGAEALLDQISNRINQLSDLHNGEPVSVIGWSLGGIYAREIAKVMPDTIRQVITLGTPFKGEAGETNATFLYELLSKDTSYKDPDVVRCISTPPPVPFTSIYSKSDGIVHWECCLEDEGHMIQNIEIPGASHLGLGHNPTAMLIIADRLTQSKDNWQPFIQ